jgi:putrescine aminotransferase
VTIIDIDNPITRQGAPAMVRLEDVPGLPIDKVKEWHKAHLNPSLIALMELGGYDRVRITRAEGAWLHTSDGRKLLDLVSSYGALSHGHNHPRVVAAARWFDEQGAPDLLKEFPSPYPAALAHNLAQVTPGDLDVVFFCNSGTEAIEGALKLSMRVFQGKRHRFAYTEGSLHGKTLGSLQVTGREKYRGHVRRFSDWPMVPFGDVDALADVLADDAKAPGGPTIAGVVLEPVQGEGGVVVPPTGYLKQVEALCRRHGVLLILDEVQTGFGRTGAMFRCEAEDVVPDILCAAKSLGGGVATIGVTITRPALYQRAYGTINECLVHTSTFGGRGRACAVSLEALNVAVEEDFAGRARTLGAYLRNELEGVARRHPDKVVGVRGVGLMLGLELAPVEVPRLAMPIGRGGLQKIVDNYLPGIIGAELLHEHGIVASFMLNHPRVLRVYPPLVATEQDLSIIAPALDAVLSKGWSRLLAARVQSALSHAGLSTVMDWLSRW